jgi:hypothetical protein
MNKAKKYKLKLDYTADELNELKEISRNYSSSINAIVEIVDSVSGDGLLRNLGAKYLTIDYEDDSDFVVDINNVVMGTAIFPEKKYVVHDKVTDQYVYYSSPWKGLHWGSFQIGTGAEEKTKEGWLAINPAYEQMLEETED